MGNVAQIRDKKLFYFCAAFLLTNLWGYGIIEICAHYNRGRAVEILK